MMPNIRLLLNKIKWTADITKIQIWYRHYGAPKNLKKLSGNDIITIGCSFLETPTKKIPYHRIQKIQNNNHILFNRNHI